MNDFGSTECKEAYGDNSSKYKAIFYSKQFIRNLTGSDSQSRTILSPGGHVAMPGDTSAHHSWGGPTGTYWVEANDAANHPLKCTTAPPSPNRKSPGPKFNSAEAEKPWDRGDSTKPKRETS